MADHGFYWLIDNVGNLFAFGADTDYRVGNVTGLLSAPPVDSASQKVHGRHGSMKSGLRTYNERIVTMDISVTSNPVDVVETMLDDLQGAFQVSDEEYILVTQRRNKSPRYLNCHVTRSEFIGNYDAYTGMIKGVVELKALDPLLYEFDLFGSNTAVVKPSDSTVGRAYNLTYPRVYPSASMIIDSINNDGTIEMFPRILIEGPIINPRLKNNTTGKIFGLNTSIGPGETVEIDMRIHSVVKNGGQSIRNTVDAYSEWWGLAPVGANEILMLGSGAGPQTLGTVIGGSAWSSA